MFDTLSEMVDMLVQLEASISQLTAARTQLLETMRSWSDLSDRASGTSTGMSREVAFRSLRAEVSCALRVTERTAEDLFGEARMLVRDLPATMGALSAGRISYRHAQVMVDQAAGLSLSDRDTLERLAVPVAETSTPQSFAHRARRLREGLDPTTIEARTKAAVEDRHVVLVAGRDGMGELIVHAPMHQLLAVHSRATEHATRLQGPTEPRTLTQLRADAVVDALLNGTMEALGGRRIRPDVYLTVPVLSLLGESDIPATLDGYGPIPISLARELAADAPSFVRVLTHPETGATLSVGRTRYSPPADMKTAKRFEQPECGFPACDKPAEFCDLDHIHDWIKDGHTSLKNLAYLCPGHHDLKHATAWNYTRTDDGTLHWTSPAHRTYTEMPTRPATPEAPGFG